MILNPIVDPNVLALDAALEGEHRIQALFALWFANYFTGTPFTTRAPGGGTEEKTFIACEFQWQEDEMPENPQKPLIHTVFHDPVKQRMDMMAGVFGHADRWMIDIMIKVPSNLSGTPHRGKNPEHVARRVAGQVEWLLSGAERDALVACGVEELRTERPPTILPGTSWHMRMLVASCLTRRQQAR